MLFQLLFPFFMSFLYLGFSLENVAADWLRKLDMVRYDNNSKIDSILFLFFIYYTAVVFEAVTLIEIILSSFEMEEITCSLCC